jgi:hypothetical protein
MDVPELLFYLQDEKVTHHYHGGFFVPGQLHSERLAW